MDFDQQMILDATRGSIARFVNHSCEPNCKMVKWTVSGTPRMALFAGEKGIMTGEELTYDYNFSPYSVKNVQECRCGAPSCRGILGPKPKEIREALKPLTTGGKRKLQQAYENTVEIEVRKHRPNVPSVTRALAIVKDGARKKLTKSNILESLSTRNEKFIQKVSAKVIEGTQKPEEEKEETIQKTEKPTKRHVTVTYSCRRQSAGTNVENDNDERPADMEINLQPKTALVKDPAVRIVRRSTRTRLSNGIGEIQGPEGARD
jgi:[histone H3]-lysine4 N-trimethyltransferase ASH1L